jgi:hypothetical protein
MSFADSLARIRARFTPRHIFGIVVLCVVVVLATLLINRTPTGGTPAPQATAPVVKPSAAPVAKVQAGPQWHELSSGHKKILHPLAGTWNSLSYAHKNKWLALASNYPNRTPEDQAKLQSRMAEWAALTPGDRERARLNFAETKKLSPSERAAEWAAYQELSSEEKKRLAEKGAAKPAGAAVAVTPAPNDKLTAVPITRRTSQLQESATVAKPQINPNTLLPKVAPPVPSAPAPADTDNTPGAATVGSSPAISSDTLSPN